MKRTKQHTTYETHFKHKLNMLEPGIAMCRLICALVALGIAFLLMPIKIIAYIAFGLAGLTDIVNISYARHWLSLPPRCTCDRNLRSASGFYYHHGIHTSAMPSHAEMLLATTDFFIAQVAAAVGYRSEGRFAALPKENCGLYPAEYRQMARSSGECRK